MMNKNSKSFVWGVVSFSVLAAGPALVLAQDTTPWQEHQQEVQEHREEMKSEREAAAEERKQEREDKMEERKAKVQEVRCENITRATEAIMTRLEKREQEFSTRKENWGQTWQDRSDEVDDDLASQREKADKRREEMYANMLEKATTNEQKAAITDFQNTVEAAVDERRDAVNKALEDFRSAAENLRDDRKTTHDDAVAQFKAAVEAAVNEAESSCDSSDADPKTVRETLHSSLKSAQEKLRSELGKDGDASDGLKSLIETRRAAVEAAMNTFHDKLEAAREELKTALNASS